MTTTEKMNAVSTPGCTTTWKMLLSMTIFFSDASRVTCKFRRRNSQQIQLHMIDLVCAKMSIGVDGIYLKEATQDYSAIHADPSVA